MQRLLQSALLLVCLLAAQCFSTACLACCGARSAGTPPACMHTPTSAMQASMAAQTHCPGCTHSMGSSMQASAHSYLAVCAHDAQEAPALGDVRHSIVTSDAASASELIGSPDLSLCVFPWEAPHSLQIGHAQGLLSQHRSHQARSPLPLRV